MLRLVLSTCLLIVSLAAAAPVAWTPPSTIAGDTDVSAAGATVETVTSGGGNTVTLSYSNAAANTAGGIGQFSIGTFTADAATQVITLTGNTGGSTQINALQLRDLTAVAPSGPAITVQPQSQSVVLGDTITLSVTATGTAPLTYQWSLNEPAHRRSHRRHPRSIQCDRRPSRRLHRDRHQRRSQAPPAPPPTSRPSTHSIPPPPSMFTTPSGPPRA